MQPKMSSKCKKNIAVVFITKVENGVTMNGGYCLKCARSLGIPQIDQAVNGVDQLSAFLRRHGADPLIQRRVEVAGISGQL